MASVKAWRRRDIFAGKCCYKITQCADCRFGAKVILVVSYGTIQTILVPAKHNILYGITWGKSFRLHKTAKRKIRPLPMLYVLHVLHTTP